ncbi:MAG TPA: hypothetical protein VMU82_11935 [Acetobacteraceae bacterium]|nr:hypothetical protein [Acetobacteraceae bacterium]
MRTLPALVLVGLVGATVGAHADFIVLHEDSPSAPTPVEPIGQRSTGTPRPPNRGAATPIVWHAPPRFSTVRGFGHQIPLSFAVRQIVPPKVKVTFGTGADPAALIDWNGGRPWNAVLRDTVRPLGLHLIVHRKEVTISR